MVATVRALNTRYDFDTRQIAIYGGLAAGALIAVTFVWDLLGAARTSTGRPMSTTPEWDPMAGGHPVPPLPGQTLPELDRGGSASSTEEDR